MYVCVGMHIHMCACAVRMHTIRYHEVTLNLESACMRYIIRMPMCALYAHVRAQTHLCQGDPISMRQICMRHDTSERDPWKMLLHACIFWARSQGQKHAAHAIV
mmetsp:Transcript_56991/g.127250  ORF Transcript_56991/g.127250 Transcript_56991/m.127250 type:complete len:104 (-) Transcript_56991:103-414(-)